MMEPDDRPLLTQWDGCGGGDDDENSASFTQDFDVNNNNTAGGPSGNIFDEEEDDDDHTGKIRDEFEGDGFNLLTQINDSFKQGHGTSDSSESECSSSSSESSSDDDINQGEALQQRRAKNIERNEAFAKSLKMEMNAMLEKDGAQPSKRRKRKAKEIIDSTNSRSPDRGRTTTQQQNKRRGMLFPTTFNGMSYNQHVKQPLQTTTLTQELNAKYPHRSKQIYYLCARLQSIVSRTKMAWKMTENVRSYGESHYSEASYAGRVKMSVPPPILISGPGGSGKTSIVCDTIQSLRERTNNGTGGEGLSIYQVVASAYVDCASAEANSVASVMNNAYRQLYECYHSKENGGRQKKSRNGKDRKRTTAEFEMHTTSMGSDSKRDKSDAGYDNTISTPIKSPSKRAPKSPMLRVNDMGGYDDDSEGYDDDDGEDVDEEDLIERQRKRRVGKKRSKQKKRQLFADGKSTTSHTRHTRQNIARENGEQSIATQNQSGVLKNSVQGSNRNHQDSSSIAIFGRAISSLLQGDISKKRAPRHGRCAFLILDNADRILSWNKSRRNNPLAELLLLPKIMGINLTLVLISRSSLYQYSRVQMPPGTILDAVQPNHIHFDAYSSVDTIKDIMLVPRIRQMVIGQSNLTRHKHVCVAVNAVRARFEQMCYSSLLGWFISNVKGSTQDLTEIVRLARLLWPEYVAPLDGSAGSISPAFELAMTRILCHLREDDGETSVDCNCSTCKFLSSADGTHSDGDEDFAVLKQRLFEKLDQNIRETMRGFLSTVVLMPGRVLSKHTSKPYAERLPYVTKFLLLAAFLCQNKKAESDKNLFTKKSTGKSRRSTNKADVGSSYASSTAELKQLTVRQTSFPVERLLSVFYSIMGSYGQNSVHQNGEGTNVSEMGTERLFQNISQLNATGLIRRVGSSSTNASKSKDLTEMTAAKFTSTLSREDAHLIAESVGFPLDRYCP
uniref:AAA+ ATPase domain-containing protein n=1 Tax=Skeletonema marinoi TaxID=267567 RepID=A0A7S2P639_9STRA|mmetsp:Transcript_1358/g.2248  ORF Transcript_1358/g.2248 Transcript_1358/m.2248 type:complete len:957 (+) Transcript_1358:50-2920(+)